ncbi:elongation of very long chain fatty acids protein-like [Schistocerca gregaria]|uniref:elongation of very long chain fatty acids protein-like n=1 Tax=Schistocerca gregaria TaxID=7010 RepID=UPI00211DA92B|nr:elongation of very long chain fatty acids protein-like [Schistocerca gregaria]XP_049844737.1 elongation of very long chain fatty acids protein-like [Schistocerca gregaria]
MTLQVVADLVNFYRDLMDNRSDQRVKDWPFMSGPLPTLLICVSYAYIAKVVGPRLMRDRKAMQLKVPLVLYNLAQVFFSMWLFYELLMGGWWNRYSFRCQPVDYSNDPVALRMARACWWYYFSKYTEFIDTLFFILRKKNEQITNLHVIHHGVMPMSVWFGVKFTPGGHSSFFGLLNTFVHVVMYTYYMLAAMGPQMRPYLWWKKYLTAFQMVQFVLMMVHAFQLLFIECDYPKGFVWWIGMHALMFYFLFSDFYKQAYRNDRKSKKDDDATAVTSNKTEAVTENGHLKEVEKKDAANGTVHSSMNGYLQHSESNVDGVRSRAKEAAPLKESDIGDESSKNVSEIGFWERFTTNFPMFCIPDQTVLLQNH